MKKISIILLILTFSLSSFAGPNINFKAVYVPTVDHYLQTKNRVVLLINDMIYDGQILRGESLTVAVSGSMLASGSVSRSNDTLYVFDQATDQEIEAELKKFFRMNVIVPVYLSYDSRGGATTEEVEKVRKTFDRVLKKYQNYNIRLVFPNYTTVQVNPIMGKGIYISGNLIYVGTEITSDIIELHLTNFIQESY